MSTQLMRWPKPEHGFAREVLKMHDRAPSGNGISWLPKTELHLAAAQLCASCEAPVA